MERFCQLIINQIGEKPFVWTVYLTGLAISVGMSYGFALIGEPRSYWLWHTIFGAI
ncbi:hypothetical protein [Rhizobium rhizogenes]|uniref:hypothetical protein n=1 Tax=Rhizobium rhizogenes TaxID=359 RepID=UPI00157333DB|nr:hypothetical protein [Rhizobium rhizogenes]NTG07241.1 hypothetical protein [Rhizobium rhizogenes]